MPADMIRIQALALPAPMSRADAPPGPDAIHVLRVEHEHTCKLFAAHAEISARGSTPSTLRQLTRRICTALTVRHGLETQIFYPAARTVLDQPALVDSAQDALEQIARMSKEVYTLQSVHQPIDEHVAYLEQLVLDHGRFDEVAIFSPLRRHGVELGELGGALIRWRDHLMASSPLA